MNDLHCSHNKKQYSPRIIVILIVACLYNFSSFSQETVLHQFKSTTPDAALEKRLYLASGVELLNLGLSSTEKTEKFNYVLFTEYLQGNNELAITYSLVKVESLNTVLASLSATISTAYGFDAEISKNIRNLFSLAEISGKPSKLAKIDGLFTEINPLPNSETKDTQKSTATKIVLEKTEERKSILSKKPFYIETGLSSLYSSFYTPSSELFKYAIGAQANILALWHTENLGFGFGPAFSIQKIYNNDTVNGDDLYLSKLALTFLCAYDFYKENNLSPELRACFSLGPSFLTLSNSTTLLTATSPFGEAGLSLIVPIDAGISLAVNTSFSSIFRTEASNQSFFVISMQSFGLSVKRIL